MDETPVDYSKSKFSIDFLLEKPNQSAFSAPANQPKLAGQNRSRSATPESMEKDEQSPSPSHSRPYSIGDSDRPKRPRTAFTSGQIKALESEFEKNKYLSVAKRIELSRQLGLSQQQLKVWYQNRRTKWKRKYANDLESMAQQYYSSLGIPGSRPMLIGDRLWIFNAAQVSANEVLLNDHPNYRRGPLEPPSLMTSNGLPASAHLPLAGHTFLGTPPGLTPYGALNFAMRKPST